MFALHSNHECCCSLQACSLFVGVAEVMLEKHAKGNASVRGRGSKWLFPLLLLLTRSVMACFTHHKWRAC